MKKTLPIAVVIIAMLCTPRPGFSWGGVAHVVIDHTAIDTLPDDGPIFLRRYVTDIAALALFPDWWRDDAYPDEYAKTEEGAKHRWPVERFTFLQEIPRSRDEPALKLNREYGDKSHPEPFNVIPRADGIPYAAAEVYGHLIACFRMLRGARSAGGNTAVLENSCAFYVAWLGHYIGDGSQPLHTSMHIAGWVGPDPNGYTRDRSIHNRFEASYVDKIDLSEKDILSRIGSPDHQTGDVFQLIIQYLNERASHVEAIYKMDKRNAFADPSDREAKELVYSSVAAGASMLRDLIYRAWLESALPQPPPVYPK